MSTATRSPSSRLRPLAALGLLLGIGAGEAHAAKWADLAASAQTTLDQLYLDPATGSYRNTPEPTHPANDTFNYWWLAHAIDVLVDRASRTGLAEDRAAIRTLRDAVAHRNGGALPNHFYDDMGWMGLALLRAHQLTGEPAYLADARLLWHEISVSENQEQGGGIPWKRDALAYKNAPTNGTAIMLGARLHLHTPDPATLAQAERLFIWMKKHLVDPNTGFVWDGINRENDGKTDKTWRFTYCQGVYIAAALDLYQATKKTSYLDQAERTARTSMRDLSTPRGILAEGSSPTNDQGLFKGIYVRHLAELARSGRQRAAIRDFLEKNARAAVETAHSRPPAGPLHFSSNWSQVITQIPSVGEQLSGIMLLEQLARFEREASPATR